MKAEELTTESPDANLTAINVLAGQDAHSTARIEDSPRKDIAAPTSIGKYVIEGELGRGACGVVYRGFDPFVQRPVAVKVAIPGPGAMGAGEEGFAHEFFVEARSAGQLQHPNIVGVLDAGSDAGRQYIVMEYVEGVTLDKWRPPDIETVVNVAVDCAQALDYAHARGVLHRDIKPENIMLRGDGVAKVMDFSIAAVMQGDSFRPDQVLGTPSFMAPEQIAGTRIRVTSDLYSLGAVFFSILAGRPPHIARPLPKLLQAIQTTQPPRLCDLRPEVPARLGAVIDRALSLDPKQRFSSGAEFAEALSASLHTGSDSKRDIAGAERVALAKLEFCRHMNPVVVDELIGAGHLRKTGAGEPVLFPGMKNRHLYVVVSGELEESGTPPRALQRDSVFGVLGLPHTDIEARSVISKQPSVLLEVSDQALDGCSEACRAAVYQACCAALLRAPKS